MLSAILVLAIGAIFHRYAPGFHYALDRYATELEPNKGIKDTDGLLDKGKMNPGHLFHKGIKDR
jgi:hypothetical protein